MSQRTETLTSQPCGIDSESDLAERVDSEAVA